MVVLAASVCTRSGKPLLSRQFCPIPRSRIDSLLASFPKLIPANVQHTTVETADVRFVYQPFEELYVLLITNKSSNILQDINTLSLVVRLIASLTPAMTESAILHHSFDLLCAFDEVVSLGYKENVTLAQVRSVLEGESHEEKIQEIIARNKEAEAKEELKRRAKQLEMQRREAARGGRPANSGGFGAGGYASVPTQMPRDEAPVVDMRARSPAPAPKPSFKGSGMKLGAKKAPKSDLFSSLGAEYAEPEPETYAAPSSPVAAARAAAPPATAPIHVSPGILAAVPHDSIHATIKEQLSVTMLRDGGVQSLELKGDMHLAISDPSLAKLSLTLADGANPDSQFKQHPKFDKFAPEGPKVIALKDKSRAIPTGGLGVLRWRVANKDESIVPLTVTVWPQERGDGTADVAVEYELENTDAEIKGLVISIPIPPGSSPEVSEDADYHVEGSSFVWTVGDVDDSQTNGSLEFRCSGDLNAFFPVQVGFVAATSLAGISIDSAILADGSAPSVSVEKILTVDKYEIV